MKRVACGISGGVDSAISAYLLKQQSYKVIGVFMTNWDAKDESGFCSVDKDREDAKYICRNLKIDFMDINFIKDYWINVFEKTLNSYKRGLTPNPDIMCNKEIKFKRFANFCINKLNVDFFATGHYAKIVPDFNSTPLLVRPRDKVKDQTYWLSQIDPIILRRCIFPLFDLTKCQVKAIANEIGLQRIVARKESMGMCFIGKRKFNEFIDSYLEPQEGLFTILETGEIVGKHTGIHHYTLGQRAGISMGAKGGLVAKMDPVSQEIKIVFDLMHPVLYMRTLYTGPPHWLVDGFELQIKERGVMKLRMQYQNRYKSIPCTVEYANNGLLVKLGEWFRCVAPGQFAVLYSEDDQVCVGSAVVETSLSAWDEGVPGPEYWSLNDYENANIRTL